MAQTGRTRRRRLTGPLLLMIMTMTMMMTEQDSNSLGLVQAVGCMSHKQTTRRKNLEHPIVETRQRQRLDLRGPHRQKRARLHCLASKVCASKYYPICQKLGSGLDID